MEQHTNMHCAVSCVPVAMVKSWSLVKKKAQIWLRIILPDEVVERSEVVGAGSLILASCLVLPTVVKVQPCHLLDHRFAVSRDEAERCSLHKLELLQEPASSLDVALAQIEQNTAEASVLHTVGKCVSLSVTGKIHEYNMHLRSKVDKIVHNQNWVLAAGSEGEDALPLVGQVFLQQQRAWVVHQRGRVVVEGDNKRLRLAGCLHCRQLASNFVRFFQDSKLVAPHHWQVGGLQSQVVVYVS